MVGIVGWIAVAQVASAATAQWSVVPPPGWKDATATASQSDEVRKAQQNVAAKGGGMDFVRYESGEGDTLAVVFMRMAARRAVVGQAVRSFEAGAHNAIVKQKGKDTSYTTREDYNMLVADEVIGDPTGAFRGRRLVGVNDTHLVSLTGSCTGPEVVCVAALQSLTLDGTGLRPLTATGVDPLSASYAAGEAAGRSLVVASPILLIVWWLLRRRKRQEST